MSPNPDIHQYDRRYESTLNQLEHPEKGKPISERNRKLIMDFDQFNVLDHLSVPRRIKLISALNIFAKEYLKKDFEVDEQEGKEVEDDSDQIGFCS
jgi:hypothetical protein